MVTSVETLAKNETVNAKQVGKRYQIVKSLSVGGMSQTYLAKDMQRPNHPVCVVKKLKVTTHTKEELKTTKRLFEREAETLEKLGSHDQVPRLLAYFEEDNKFFLVQEFIEGQPLSNQMTLGECWSETQVMQLLKEMLEVLASVHEQNVIHLDIKPANIIRRHDGKLVLIDFGAVKRVHLQPPARAELGKTQSTVLTYVGTKGYMSIEQMMGKPHLSSDIYALGMTAIQALTGILPLQLRDDDSGEVVWQDQAEVSDGLATILKTMVRRYHKQRYQSVAEVMSAISELEMAAIVQSALPIKIESAQSINPQSISQEHFVGSLPTVQSKPNMTEASSHDFPEQLMQFSRSDFSQLGQGYTSPNSLPTINSPVGFIKTELNSSSESSTKKIESSSVKKPSLNMTFLKQKGLLQKLGIGILTASLVLGSGYAAYGQWQRQQSKTLLEEITALAQQGKTEACIAQATTFPKASSDLHRQAVEILETCSQQVIDKADKLYKESSLLAAVELLNTVPEESPIAYKKAQIFAEEWHAEIVTRAEEHYKLYRANDAIAMLKALLEALSEDSPAYKEAKQKATSWQAERASNNILISEAQALVDNDEHLSASESYRSDNKVRPARESLSTGKTITQSAQAKVDTLRVLGKPVEINETSLDNLKGLKKLTESIAWRVKEAKELDYWIDIKEKTPLEILKGDLSKGVSDVKLLATEIDNKNVLAKDYPLWGNKGDIWTISMESNDFQTMVHLIDPNGLVTSSRSRVVSNGKRSRNLNSRLRSIKLPQDGYYRVRASAHYSASNNSPAGTGRYQLFVTNE